MKRNTFYLMVCAILFIIFTSSGLAQTKYWIFFVDKGPDVSRLAKARKLARTRLSSRCLERRRKVLPEESLVDDTDVEIYDLYLNKLHQLGVKPIVKSNWLNAVSAVMDSETVQVVKSLSFVRRIKPVARANTNPPLEVFSDLSVRKPQNYQLDYGASLDQNELIHVPEVHELGLDGNGVVVGMLDTGFNYRFHAAFEYLKVLDEFDFINNDSTTKNEDSDPASQHNHGTATLSAIAGFSPGNLIGPAFSASYLLAKTEDVSNEYPQEEDFWVAGLEWLESQGADIVSSSLGYNDWYSYCDMDGETAVTTIAADIAVRKGVVVVTSMGNEGNNNWHYMIAPADGNYVISVGATDRSGQITSFSSRGPTYDHRIKPDVVAMGLNVHVVSANSIDSYRTANGTSLSCPLVAGVAALVLQAHPYLNPIQVRDALRETADHSHSPDNEYGWGVVNAYDAIFYHGLFFSNMPEIQNDDQLGHLVKVKIYSKYPLVSDSLFLYYSIEDQEFNKVLLAATEEQNEFAYQIPLQPAGTKIHVYFSAMDANGDYKYHPYKAPEAHFTFTVLDTTMSKEESLPVDYKLYQNFPNPFSDWTSIKFDVIKAGRVDLTIFNIRGQKVKTLVQDYQVPGRHVRYWNGTDESGKKIAAGIYFCRLIAGNDFIVKRMVFWGRREK